MQQRRKIEVPTGPALRAEQVSEFWVWIWSTIDQSAPDALEIERVEAQRLAVAFERAIDRRSEGHDGHSGPVSTGLLAHYLMIRIEHLSARDASASRRRLRVVTEAAELLNSLLGLEASAWSEHFERLGIALGQRSLFLPEVREGITIESLEEGPALPRELETRNAQASARREARWQAERDRPRKHRQLEEEAP